MTRRRFNGAAALVAAVLALGLPGVTSAHHAVLRFNLEEMTVTADRIFVGRCLAAEPGQEAIAQGLMPVTRYTFEVERVVKGQLPDRFTFLQLGHPAPVKSAKGGQITAHGQPVSPATLLHGMSAYKVGERVMLFLIPDYLGGKVTYPVGLDQGAFFVARGDSGEETARNNINNLGLLTAPYNGTKLKDADARVVHPDDGAVTPNARSAARAASLPSRGGAWPLETLVGLAEEIHAAHGGAKGALAGGGQKGGDR